MCAEGHHCTSMRVSLSCGAAKGTFDYTARNTPEAVAIISWSGVAEKRAIRERDIKPALETVETYLPFTTYKTEHSGSVMFNTKDAYFKCLHKLSVFSQVPKKDTAWYNYTAAYRNYLHIFYWC